MLVVIVFIVCFAVIIGIISIFGSKSSDTLNSTELTKNLEANEFLDRTPFIIPYEYSHYTFLDYSVRELSYPERDTRYYAVVTITGGKLGNNKVNAIIHFHGDDKNDIWSYDLQSKCTYYNYEYFSFDDVKIRLNNYFKDIGAGIRSKDHTKNSKTADKNYAYYFKTKEDATFALCQFKKCVDERYRKKELSVNNISETETKITFTD